MNVYLNDELKDMFFNLNLIQSYTVFRISR